ncbi:NAD-dependent deacetylase [Dysgonomonas sp. PH5-45]|uniref:SIR2 family NAD-dependent protein deacylase n=1 Tax=unclassified Dysgonomonas TaxID=2630389 RepID=UPI0024739B2A|nr:MULTISPECIES: NAD-dependent deacylase [unclassified Dysgonomonas]MDH6354859.1 NAD-dependent deacetylase [Dysgonomonas sp. PH5-45]MDH6387758.1 NAD-dependent deacetylase [Dysgonomonas sp. PH5-37]
MSKKKIVVLTGAGMSAESGISTFRDSGGLWEQYNVEDVATPEGFRRNPELVLEFYNKRRRESFKAKSNAGHVGLAQMEQDFDVEIITQNVDNLHEKAGSTKVLHLHGELVKVQSVANPNLIYTLTEEKPDIHVGDKGEDGAQLRPHIVWFGEAVPAIEEAIGVVEKADALVIIGTSLNVYPAAGLVNYAKPGVPIFLIDPQEVKAPRQGIHFIRKGAGEGVSELRNLLKYL